MPQPASTRSLPGEENWTATGRERPVFLDEHGKRRRWVLLAGSLTGGVSACWLGALVAGAIGFWTLPPAVTHSSLAARRGPYAERVPPAGGLRVGRHSPRAIRGRRASDLEPASELAVSRGLSATP